jgi:hypothetical protein
MPRMTDEDLHSCVRGEIERAIQYTDGVISPKREAASRFYDGEKFGDEEEGRSQVISLDVRDTVNALMPSLMRIFFGPEHVVEYAPEGAEDVELAKQQTDYADYIVKRDNHGYRILHAAFKDALVRKCGVVKFWWDNSYSGAETSEFSGLTEQDIGILLQEEENGGPEIEIKSEADPETGLISGKITRRYRRDRIRLAAVPPEEFIISPFAKSLEDARFVGHRAKVAASDLVAMGYDPEEVAGATTHNPLIDNVEATQRQYDKRYQDYDTSDPSQKPVLYVEGYLKVDFDGDGVSELRKICTIGEDYRIVRNEAWDLVPFAEFCPDPEPHIFFGTSIADLTMDIQRVKSAVLRHMLDSLAQSIHPRTVVTEGQVNIQDALNTEVGAIIRANAPGMVAELTKDFVGREAFQVLDYYDAIRENRTGITKAAAGLDPDALQSTTRAAVAATISAASQRIEMIARNFAETGMRQLFGGILKLIAKHQRRTRVVRLRNRWVAIDPASWRADMDVVVNVAVGEGTIEERLNVLREIIGKQEGILQTMGPANPLVSLSQYSNTLRRAVEMAGFRDLDSFFNAVDPNWQPPQQQPPSDPAALLAQAQMEEIKANMATKSAEMQLKREQALMADDRERDKLDADIMLRAAEIESKYNTQVNIAQIKAAVDRDRNRQRVSA